MLMEKYQSLIDMANQLGISGLQVVESEGVLKVDGVAGSAEAKQQLWDEYNRLDPDMRSGDVVLNLDVAAGSETIYTVVSGDSLSKIATKYTGVTWQKIFEANRDQIKNPDLIHPGQKLRIPTA